MSEGNPFDNMGNERQEFVEYYGPYMEMIYIITNGDMLKANEVYKMPAHEFMFYCEYLVGKRNLEIKEENARNKK